MPSSCCSLTRASDGMRRWPSGGTMWISRSASFGSNEPSSVACLARQRAGTAARRHEPAGYDQVRGVTTVTNGQRTVDLAPGFPDVLPPASARLVELEGNAAMIRRWTRRSRRCAKRRSPTPWSAVFGPTRFPTRRRSHDRRRLNGIGVRSLRFESIPGHRADWDNSPQRPRCRGATSHRFSTRAV